MVLTLAVNREYLPSEKYVLRNITIQPDIPKDSTKDSWPFDIIDASKVRHLDDMSYNSTAEVWYKFSVSQFAKEGVYPINFKVNATVWREDSVNGTAITEDVTFTLNVFLTVTENGDMSGVVSNIGPLNVAGRENTAIASPTGSPGETVVMSMPIVNKGGTLENVTVSPVVTGDLETFPFVAEDINYGRELGRMENGTRQQVDWIFKISPYATTGNKIVTFRATYEENGVYGECTFTGYIYVKNGYTPNTAASLMVEGYALYMDDTQVDNLTAGSDALLKVTLKNNAAKNAIYKTVATLKLADANSLILTSGYSDAAYVRSIPAGQTTEIEYHITARASASVGPSTATIALTYETSENEGAVAGSATSTIQIPIKQEMDLQIDTPVIYGTPVQDEPLAVSLNIVNLGRSRAYNVRIVGMDGVSMHAQSTLYMRIYFLGMPFFMLYNYGAAILRAVGDTKRPLLFLVISGCANALLDLIFVIGFHLGVAGVATATITAQMISCILVLLCLYRTDSCYQLRFSKLKIKKVYLLQIFQVGIPAGIQSTVINFSNALLQSSVNSFGDTAMAGYTAANNILGFLYMSVNSITQACMSFTSQNYGVGKYKRIPMLADSAGTKLPICAIRTISRVN